MADKINANRLGMTLGIFVALWHLVWAVLVGIGIAQDMIDWVLPLHFISLTVPMITFSWLNALILIIAGFIGGYIIGWVFAALWNCKCLCKK